MKRQEIIDKFRKQISIENYSEQTIKSYLSVLKLFGEWIEKSELEKVEENEIQNYLFYCKTEKNYSIDSISNFEKANHFFPKSFKLAPK